MFDSPSGVVYMFDGGPGQAQALTWAAHWAELLDQPLTIVAPDESTPVHVTGQAQGLQRLARALSPGLDVRLIRTRKNSYGASHPARSATCLVTAVTSDPGAPPTKEIPPCPVVVVPADAVVCEGHCPIVVLLGNPNRSYSAAAYAFAHAHRTGRSLRAVLVDASASAREVLWEMARCYPNVPLDVQTLAGATPTSFAANAHGAALVVAGSSLHEDGQSTADPGWDVHELLGLLSCPIALVSTDVFSERLVAAASA